MRINNTYSESFRVKAVAVVRSGYAVSTTAKRLGMPETSLRNWMKHPRYAEVQPAAEEVLAALPESQVNETKLVPITKTERKNLPFGEIKIKVGKMEMSLPQDFGKDSFVTIIKALGEAGVL